MRITVLAPRYVPGHKAGGPIPGIWNAVGSLDGHDVEVLTSDRDLGDRSPFPPPHRGTVMVDAASVTYLPPPSWRSLREWGVALVRMRKSDGIYVNSLMSKPYAVVPVVLLVLSGYTGNVAISPRGELSGTAMGLGGVRQKKLWVGMLRTFRWHRRLGRTGRDNVVWVASSARERDDIVGSFPEASVVVVPEALRPQSLRKSPDRPVVQEGLRLISVGRIAPIKGTQDLVRALGRVGVSVSLDLVGLAEDATYSAAVEQSERELPAHVSVNRVGPVPPDEVERRLESSHVFVLLTRGENFGHAIGEALRSGCPVIISDQTPWSFIAEAGAGVVLTPAQCQDPTVVAEAIERYARLPEAAWEDVARRARASVNLLEGATGTLAEALSSAWH